MHQCEYSSLIGFLLSPKKLMVWRIFNEKDKSKQEDYNLYYTMFMKFSKDAVVFSSEPLDEDAWTLLPNKSFISIEPDGNKLKMNFGLLS